MTLRDPTPLLLPVVRPVLLPRELPLLTLQPFALVGEVERPDSGTVRVVGVFENPYVDTNTLLGTLGGSGGSRSISTPKVANHSPVGSFLTVTCLSLASSGMVR